MLKPGQLAQFDRLIGETEIKNVDVSNYIGWKSGVYIFEDKSIEQIMDELSLWYDIEVFSVIIFPVTVISVEACPVIGKSTIC